MKATTTSISICQLAFVVFLSVLQTGLALSCLNDDGNPVNWFIGLKLPKGLKYFKLEDNGHFDWTLSQQSLDGPGMISNTFSAAFALRDKPAAMFGMYNDETVEPSKQEQTMRSRKPHNDYWWGHMKGIFAMDQDGTGFWLIHSVPKMSHQNDTFEYPSSGHIYAQSMFCLNIDLKTLPVLIESMIISRPLFQGYYLSAELKAKFPKLEPLLKNTKLQAQSNTLVTDLSLASLTLRYFSKSIAFDNDLYGNLVAPRLKVGLYMEGWRHGPGPLPSDCDDEYEVENIEMVSWDKFGYPDQLIKTMEDHSKWAVSTETSSEKWVCIADINRMGTQFVRGGGAMCIKHDSLWKAFFGIVKMVEQCPHRYLEVAPMSAVEPAQEIPFA